MRPLYIYANRTASVQKSRVEVANHRIVPMRPPNVQNAKGEKSDWWEKKTVKEQEAYHKVHPKSRKHKHLNPANDAHDHVPEITKENTKDFDKNKGEQVADFKRSGTKIVWPESVKPALPEKKSAEDLEKERRMAAAWQYQHNKRTKAHGHNPALSFMMRHGKIKLSREEKSGMDKADVKQAEAEYKEWESNYGKLNGDDLADVAEKYYLDNPKHAELDGVSLDKYTKADEDNEEHQNSIEEDKDEAEGSNTAQNDKVEQTFDKAYNSNPFKGMSNKQQLLLTSRAVKNIASAFSADKNQIIGNTYKFLNKDQIQLLDEAANDALQDNLQARRKRLLPAKRKRLLKMLFVAVVTAAAVATGGFPLGVLCLHHSLLISGNEGRTHECVWNALRGKDIDGKDDDDFDPHDDAVEKIVRSLKKQLYDTDDENKAEHIQEVIDNLEEQQDNYHETKYTGSRTNRRKKVKASENKPKAEYKDVSIYHKGNGSYLVHHKGKLAGTIKVLNHHEFKIHAPFVDLAMLDKDHRKQGILSHAYDKIEKHIKQKLHPSPLGLSEHADRFWRKRMQRYPEHERKTMLDNVKKVGHTYGITNPDSMSKRLDHLY